MQTTVCYDAKFVDDLYTRSEISLFTALRKFEKVNRFNHFVEETALQNAQSNCNCQWPKQKTKRRYDRSIVPVG